MKYLGTNLTKLLKDLYNQNVEHWRNKMKKTLEDGNISCFHWLVWLTMIKYSIYQKESTDSIQLPWNPNDIFEKLKKVLKFIGNLKPQQYPK